MNPRCQLIQASFHESKIPPKPADWRERLFDEPPPEGWFPKVGDRVYLRPGTTIGALRHVMAGVCSLEAGRVAVRVSAAGGKWRIKSLALEDVRPIE